MLTTTVPHVVSVVLLRVCVHGKGKEADQRFCKAWFRLEALCRPEVGVFKRESCGHSDPDKPRGCSDLSVPIFWFLSVYTFASLAWSPTQHCSN